MAHKLIPQKGVMGKRLSPPLLFGFFIRRPEKCAVGRFEANHRLPDDREWMVADSETIPAPCGSSSDVGGHLAVNSASRKLGNLPTRFFLPSLTKKTDDPLPKAGEN